MASLLAVSLALAVTTRAGANCGAEGCPLDPRGLERTNRSWAIDVTYQYVNQDVLWDGTQEAREHEPEPGHVTELYTRSSVWTLNGRAQVLSSLRLTATLPYVDRTHAHEASHELHPGHFVSEVAEWNYAGLGDASVFAQWTPLGPVTLLGGVKLPTGMENVEEIHGEQPEPPARPGTGSTDVFAGIQLLRSVSAPTLGGGSVEMPISLAAMGRWNGKGTDEYRVGDEFHTSLSTAWLMGRGVSLLAQVNALWHGADDVGTSHAEPHHTGGTTVYATPGLRVDMPGGSALFGYWQVRVFERSNGPQLIAPSHLIFGASVGFGL